MIYNNTIKNNKIFSFLHYFDFPHKKQKYIHVAGTKGKTSTSHYLYFLLQDAGYKTGLFISPHVETPSERVQYDGAFIDKESYERLSQKIDEAKKNLNLPLSFFDFWLLMAFLFFEEKKPDYVVLEVGIGGLLDTTNVVTPLISVITRIQKDHEKMLGKSYLSIVDQKMGIVKPHIPFIIGEQNVLVKLILFFKKFFLRSPEKLMMSYENFFLEDAIKVKTKQEEFFLKGPLYMVENFVLSLSTLKSLGVNMSFLKSFTHKIPGRFEKVFLSQEKTLLLDGAHNPVAIKVFVNSLIKEYGQKKWTIFFCSKEDKNIKKMLFLLKPIAKEFILMDLTDKIGSLFSEKRAENILRDKKLKYRNIDFSEIKNIFLQEENMCAVGSFYHLSLIKQEALKLSNSK